jgi:hypothetical protein
VPLRVRLAILSGVLPRLVSVTVYGALVVSKGCGPKPGEVVGGRAAVPVPLKLTVCALRGSLSLMARVALTVEGGPALKLGIVNLLG